MSRECYLLQQQYSWVRALTGARVEEEDHVPLDSAPSQDDIFLVGDKLETMEEMLLYDEKCMAR